jgi:hypothetical protein
LASGAYFELIRELTTAIDAEVLKRQGIVGKHAGDGVTAFFLSMTSAPTRARRARPSSRRTPSAPRPDGPASGSPPKGTRRGRRTAW